jgi:hypothetical protein
MEQKPTIADDNDIKRLDPRRSTIRPTKGDIIIPHIPPRLTAPEKRPRDHPKCSVMGTRNTVNVAIAISGLAE